MVTIKGDFQMINIEWEETFKIIFVETKRHIAITVGVY